MNRLRGVAALAALGCIFTACQLFTGPLDRVEFSAERVTDEQDSPFAQVELLVVNHSSEAIVVPACGERLLVGIETLSGGEWTQLTPGVCQDAIFRFETVEGGERVNSVLLLNLRGTFRFRVDVRENEDSDPKRLLSQVVEVPA